MKTIQVDRDLADLLAARAAPGESAAAVLRRELRVPSPTVAIEVDDETYAFLVARARSLGESASDILRRELGLGASPQPGAPPPASSVFHIAPGTGTQAWNTSATRVASLVGGTLEIINDDGVAHRLHTTGVPFPHPAADILPGQSASFLLLAAYDPDVSGPLHDHAAGPGAEFWLSVSAAG